MKIKESKMEKNRYSKVDAEDWMILPECCETPTTSFINDNTLVLYPETLFENIDAKDLENKCVSDIFKQI